MIVNYDHEYCFILRIVTLGGATRRCEGNGRWSRGAITCERIECPPPRAPSGGRVSGYDRTVHSQVEFSCLTGHVLEGSEVLTCARSGEWSSPAPICRFVECGELQKVPGGTVHYVNGSTHLGSVARYACGRSHQMVGGAGERVCEESGFWSGEAPSCSEIRCPLPPRPNNTVVSVSSTERLHGTSVLRNKLNSKVAYRVGSTLKYRCERGYILDANGDPEGDNSGEGGAGGGDRKSPRRKKKGEDVTPVRVVTRRCTTSGTWTGKNPRCVFLECGEPERTENSIVTLASTGATYYGSVAFYKCEDHFNLNGKTFTGKSHLFPA